MRLKPYESNPSGLSLCVSIAQFQDKNKMIKMVLTLSWRYALRWKSKGEKNENSKRGVSDNRSKYQNATIL